jgi:enoyl-CoA hydratase/carnithine racemase
MKKGCSMMETMQVKKTGKTGWICFHRPEVRNAVNRKMMEELESIWNEWEKDEQLQAVVFYGDEKAFLSGGDVGEFHQMTKTEEIRPVMLRMGKCLERIYQSHLLSIAAVEGPAVGGGCEFAASCDLCVASDSARFGMIQVNLHITSGWGGASRLMKKIGPGRALPVLLSGKVMGAKDAFETGLVDQVWEHDRFWDEVKRFVDSLVKGSPEVTARYKLLAKAVREGKDTAELLHQEAENCAALWESERHHRAVSEFLKRTRTK